MRSTTYVDGKGSKGDMVTDHCQWGTQWQAIPLLV